MGQRPAPAPCPHPGRVHRRYPLADAVRPVDLLRADRGLIVAQFAGRSRNPLLDDGDGFTFIKTVTAGG